VTNKNRFDLFIGCTAVKLTLLTWGTGPCKINVLKLPSASSAMVVPKSRDRGKRLLSKWSGNMTLLSLVGNNFAIS
jgi:hypothetical protein